MFTLLRWYFLGCHPKSAHLKTTWVRQLLFICATYLLPSRIYDTRNTDQLKKISNTIKKGKKKNENPTPGITTFYKRQPFV